MRVEPAHNPAIALAATVHALATRLLYMSRRAKSEMLERYTEAPDDNLAYQPMTQECDR